MSSPTPNPEDLRFELERASDSFLDDYRWVVNLGWDRPVAGDQEPTSGGDVSDPTYAVFTAHGPVRAKARAAARRGGTAGLMLQEGIEILTGAPVPEPHAADPPAPWGVQSAVEAFLSAYTASYTYGWGHAIAMEIRKPTRSKVRAAARKARKAIDRLEAGSHILEQALEAVGPSDPLTVLSNKTVSESELRKLEKARERRRQRGEGWGAA